MRIGFVGAGQMARALAAGFLRAGLVDAENISAVDCAEDACRAFQDQIAGASCCTPARASLDKVDVLFLAVKPQHIQSVFDEMDAPSARVLVVSIVAGLTTLQICDGWGTRRVIRVMPNTPCLVGSGAAAFSLGPGADRNDADCVQALLSSVGIACELPESLLDAVTGLSGSGPAFVYQFIEALSDGGVRAGLPRDTAVRFAAQTVMGAAQMVLQSGDHPAVLRDRVASPGGTTIAGLFALEAGGLRAAVMNAVDAATRKSIELGRRA